MTTRSPAPVSDSENEERLEEVTVRNDAAHKHGEYVRDILAQCRGTTLSNAAGRLATSNTDLGTMLLDAMKSEFMDSSAEVTQSPHIANCVEISSVDIVTGNRVRCDVWRLPLEFRAETLFFRDPDPHGRPEVAQEIRTASEELLREMFRRTAAGVRVFADDAHLEGGVVVGAVVCKPNPSLFDGQLLHRFIMYVFVW